MRSDYGKLVYMLQDTMDPALQDLLQCPCVRPINTVYKVLQEAKVRLVLASIVSPGCIFSPHYSTYGGTGYIFLRVNDTSSQADALLSDPLMKIATSEIMPEGKQR